MKALTHTFMFKSRADARCVHDSWQDLCYREDFTILTDFVNHYQCCGAGAARSRIIWLEPEQ
jgi:hypothetical protein